MSDISYLLSRYGGHAIQFGYGKASSMLLPEDQSFENVMPKFAIEMNGYSYLSSYQIRPEFMGSFEKLPEGYCTRLGVLEHLFMEIMMQHDEYVDTTIYFGKTKYRNIFSLFIKTDFSPLEFSLGKIKSSYDCVLNIRVYNKSNEELHAELNNIINIMICLLIKEMDIMETRIEFNPSKTHLGKKIELDKLMTMIEKMKKAENENEIKEILSL